MKANMICNQLEKLEQLKLISKGKLSRYLADPLNKEKATEFDQAQKAWAEQFKTVQGIVNNFLEEEMKWMSVVDTDNVQAFAKLPDVSTLDKLVQADKAKKNVNKIFGLASLMELTDDPVTSDITKNLMEALRNYDGTLDYEMIDQNVIKIRDDCYEFQLHLNKYSCYFTDENDGGHRSVAYKIKNYYDLYKDPEELFSNYDDFTESLSAMWAVDPRFNKPFTETKPIPDLTPTPVEVIAPEPPKPSIITSKVVMKIHNDCVLNNQDVAEGDQLRAHISAGMVAGEVRILHDLGVGGEMDTYAENGCPHIGNVIIGDFKIWEGGKCNPEQLTAALNFYG